MERHIRSYGFYFYLIGGICILFGPLTILRAQAHESGQSVLVGFLMVGIAILLIPIGWGIRAFKEWARIAGIILGVLLLLGFPIGTAIGLYGLWALLSIDGRRIYAGHSAPSLVMDAGGQPQIGGLSSFRGLVVGILATPVVIIIVTLLAAIGILVSQAGQQSRALYWGMLGLLVISAILLCMYYIRRSERGKHQP